MISDQKRKSDPHQKKDAGGPSTAAPRKMATTQLHEDFSREEEVKAGLTAASASSLQASSAS
jgi:hypothetical protein